LADTPAADVEVSDREYHSPTTAMERAI